MERFKSRKFLMAIGAVVLVTLTDALGVKIDTQTYWSIVGLVVTYIVSEAAIDLRHK